jgi:hypothetical protein
MTTLRARERSDHEPDARDQAWHHFIVAIDDLLATGAYTWALPTLSGIRTTVERTGIVTGAQRQALTNIANNLWPSRWR